MTLTPSLTRHLKNPERFLHLTSESRANTAAKRFSVVNPSTGDLLAEVPDMAPEDVSKAIDKAHAAQEHWAGLTARERSDILWRWHGSILEHSDDLAAILIAEMGKPLAEAKSVGGREGLALIWVEQCRCLIGVDLWPSKSRQRSVRCRRWVLARKPK
ncbi:aldehyde dehydrogenase family protein [Rhizobium sp. 007]|uniref:aldehyde dehydrogenase family protein n=1 Tax=Rhizobium sp. 007 TaxID=2785056 RepID=UPI00188F458D|nr:aldehyde dehydrogenase family protein [Rhizobium sp. 007]